ncbi:hypothetical protein OC846_001657 [Tilletia horrida]|uniref:GST N-terminal domain-containing protein n=1 Tax=Tilletia horrida TaxID=155126 RepID=A0AAN6GST3_9BASI|nr:hypothetical protein OC845_002916 [Tilletia horrida]KAK0555497.1 hypothetical protein OC846_001657 [Tilletia horrida]
MSHQVILYDVATSDGPKLYYLPNPWIARMALVHKGIDFQTEDVSLDRLRGHTPGDFRDRLQHCLGPNDRPLVPMIEVPNKDGVGTTLVGDNITIAEFLDHAYPDKPSLFTPDYSGPEPPNTASPEFRQAHTIARVFKEGYGNSDPQWANHFELCAAEIADGFASGDREYLKSDAKLNITNGWKMFEGINRAEKLAQTRRSLLPFVHILQPAPVARVANSGSSAVKADALLARPAGDPPRFLASHDKPGLLDYIVFGRYVMTRLAAPELNKAIWSKDSDAAKAWLKSYRGGKWALSEEETKSGSWFGDVELHGIEEWVERILDAHDGYARSFLENQDAKRS